MVTKGTEAIYGKIYEKKYFGTVPQGLKDTDPLFSPQKMAAGEGAGESLPVDTFTHGSSS